MKILFTGDWHIGLTTNSNKKSEKKSREKELRDAIEFIADYSESNKIDYFIHCGDIFHNSKPSFADLRFFIRTIDRISQSARKVFIIEGNHDICSEAENVGPLELSDVAFEFSNEIVEVCTDKIKVFDIRNDAGSEKKEIRITLVPFPCKLEDVVIDNSYENIVIAHTSLDGATIGHEATLLSKVCHVEKKIDNCKLISGHIHKHQILNNDYDNFCAYPGSIIINDFGEWSQEKGFIVLDTEKKTFEFVKTPHRKFFVIDFDSQFDSFSKSFDGHLSDSIVRIDLKEVEDPVANAERIERVKKFLGSQDLFDFKINIESLRKVIVRDASMKKDASPVELCKRYFEVAKIDERVQKIGFEVISESKTA